MRRPLPLPRGFYLRSTTTIARALLGKLLIHESPQGRCGGIVVEAEAYLRDDPASHAFHGKTPRNAPMFGPPGHAYVYFTYGNHFCFNAVCRREGIAEAVLIRAIEPTSGIDLMRARRRRNELRDLCSGPGKLCQALRLGRDQNELDLCGGSVLTIYEGETVPRKRIVTTTRIGLGENRAADWPLRFYVRHSEFTSRK